VTYPNWRTNVYDAWYKDLYLPWQQWLAEGGDKWTEDEVKDEGTCSFWMKLPLDLTSGSNESILYYVRRFDPAHQFFQPTPGYTTQDDPNKPDAWGSATRVERFGRTLFFSRFFWGKAGPPTPPLRPISRPGT